MSRQGDETGAVSRMEKIEGQKDESSHEEKGVEDAREERPSEAAVSKMETQSLSMVDMMIVEETHETSQSTTKETHETSQSTTKETHDTSQSTTKETHDTSQSTTKETHETSQSTTKETHDTSQSTTKETHETSQSTTKETHETSQSTTKETHDTSQSTTKETHETSQSTTKETHETSQSTTEETHETSQSTTEETQGDRPCEMKGMVVEDWARRSDQASHHRELGSSNEPIIVIEDRAMELVEDIEQVVVPDKLSDIEVMDDMLTNLEDSSVGRGEVKIGGSERADSGLVPSRGVQEIGIANDHVYVSSSLRMVTDRGPVGSAHQHSILSAVLDIEPSAIQDVMEPPDNELPLLQDIVTFEGTPPEVVVMSTAVCDLLMKKQLSEGDKEEMKEKKQTTIQNTTMADQAETMADQAETMADQAETMADPGPASCEDLSRNVSTNVETDSSNNGRHSDSDAGRHGNNSSTDATTSNSCHDDSDACNKDDSSKAPPTNPSTACVVVADKIKTRQEILM